MSDKNNNENSDLPPEDRRQSTRFVTLIRAAKLETDRGELVCVIRDVSAGGIRLRCFHGFPEGNLTLLLQNGDSYPLEMVRPGEREASFRFPDEVDVARLLKEVSDHPKRRIRVNLNVRGRVNKAGHKYSAVIHNLSQQGALIESDAKLAIDELIILELGENERIAAKVRWREDGTYGLIFETVYSLEQFAILIARFQAPDLLESEEKTAAASRRPSGTNG